MPDQDLKRPAILDALDDFNTADTANDGIMLGILNEQNELMERQERFERSEQEGSEKEPRERQVREPREREEKQEFDPKSFYDPLNTSIQAIREQNEMSAQEMRAEMAAMRQELARREQVSQQPQYDPAEYATYGQVEPLYRETQQLKGYITNQAWQNQYQRAQLELLTFKMQHPDLDVSPQELDSTFRKFVGNDVNKAIGINWTAVFADRHNKIQAPKMQSEMERLKKENEDLKKRIDRPQSARPQQQSASTQTHQVSPSLRPSGRTAVASHLNESAQDVIDLPSFAKGKSFKNYGKDLMRHGFIK